jgi:hypothetical protein
MSETKTELTTQQSESAFSLQNFEHAQRVAKMIATSSLVPQAYQGKIENVMIAMEMANRMSISPMMVMQNLYIVKGNPGWSGKFVIAMINGSKRFDTDLEFQFSGEGDSYGCIAFTTKKGKRIESTKVDWKMVKGEGWLDKPGSKWKTMPDQMFRYRSAAFFGNANTPDLLMGMQTVEEILDVESTVVKPQSILVEELQTLLDSKVAMLNKSEFDNAKRIIEAKEVDSYQKLFTFLNSKNDE